MTGKSQTYIMKSKNIFQEVIHTLILLLAAFVWGMAFPFQSIGARYLSGWSFLAIRSWLSVIVMLPAVLIIERGKGHTKESRKTDITAGVCGGIFLCLASGLQQIGIAYTTAAKSGFITALYVIFVPIFSLIMFRKKQPWKLWISVVLCVTGLYFLCMKDGFAGLSEGDIMTLICAMLFAGQILTVSHFVKRVGAVKLTFVQFVVEAIMATVLMLISEQPTLTGIYRAMPALLYAGIMSSAVGYSLQAIGQKGLNPAVASLAMCMESVFSVIGGIFILHEIPSAREAFGCVLMFAAIVLAELPMPVRKKGEYK